MAAVTICSDLGAPKNKVSHCFHIYLPWSDGAKWDDTKFCECWVLSQLFHSPLSLSSRGSLLFLCFLSLGWCHLHVWGYWYFSWQPWFQLVFLPVKCFSAYKLNKQGDNTQPCHTPFPIWNQSVVPCPVLAVASWPAYRFLKRQVRWSGIPISISIFHS